MSSILERLKQELTTEINEMISAVEFFINNKKQNENATSISQYLELNGHELNNVKNTLQSIRNEFNPQSAFAEKFENCKNQLKELQNEIIKIQARGEAEQERKRDNSATLEDASLFAGIGAVLGGVVLGFGGCVSCASQMLPAGTPGWKDHMITPFNLITGLLIGVIGGALIGVMIGAIKGQGEIALPLIVGCLLVGISVVLGIVYFTRDTAVNSTVSYDVPAIRANVTSLRFYEKGADSLLLNARNYGHTFIKSKTRYVNWELNLEHPQNGRRVDFTIKSILYRADGSIMSEQTTQSYVNSDWTGTSHTSGWGTEKFGNWQVGSYRIDLYVDGKNIASDSFTIR